MSEESQIPAWPAELPVPLLERRHQIIPRNWETVMESGRTRVRRAQLDPLEVMQATWHLTGDQYLQFQLFFREDLRQGELVFTMETLEPAPDPSKVRRTIREYAFLDGTYSFNQSDNLVIVQAVLELDAEDFEEVDNPFWRDPNPPPELPEMAVGYTPCKDEVLLTWEWSEGDIVQTAWNQQGPWFQYIWPVLTVEEAAVESFKTKTIRLNNTFRGQRWFRVADADGNQRTKSTQPDAALVDFPEVEVAGTVAPHQPLRYCPLAPGFESMGDSVAIVEPVSYVENFFISPTDLYVEVTGRRLYQHSPGIGISPSSELTIVSEHIGGLTKWTNNGGDPDVTTKNPSKGHLANYANAESAAFACLIKARCFSGDCRSPLCVLLVDKEQFLTHAVLRTQLRRKTVTNFCYHPRIVTITDPDAPDYGATYKWSTGVNSCSLYGPLEHLAMIAAARSSVCVPPEVGYDAEAPDRLVSTWSDTVQSGPTDLAHYTGTWITTSTIRWHSANITRYEQWDKGPTEVFEWSRFGLTETKLQVWTEGMPEFWSDGPVEVRCSGPGGSMAGHLEKMDPILRALTADCPVPTYYLGLFAILTTRWDDLPDPVPEEPPPLPPPPPEPPQEDPPNVYYDLFEDYDDEAAVVSGTLIFGTGWFTAWILRDGPIVRGYDLFDDYGLFSDGVLEIDPIDGIVIGPGGEGWDGEWVLRDDEAGLKYMEDWESYADGSYSPSVPFPWALGTGWAVTPGSEAFPILVPWIIRFPIFGIEDFESYIDAEDASEMSLAYADVGWTADSWILRNTLE